MAAITKGGAVLTADDTYRADLFCIGETIAAHDRIGSTSSLKHSLNIWL